MQYEVYYQQHKYIDRSDNPALRTWKIRADSPEAAHLIAQARAVRAELTEQRHITVKREMRDESQNIVTSNADYTPEYTQHCIGF